jgi:two-component system response regulator PilR (NtrC family)
MITAHGTVENAIEAMKIGAFDYVLKPFKNDEIRLLVRRAIDQRDILRENAALRKDQASRADIKNLIGTSEPVEEVREMIRRVATLPSTVAIHGESGSGKELVARGIHALSDRKDKPFVALNCGGFPENLLESELFGHKRGSFTGAVDDKEGLFVTADGGTLFLDEIGEMPLSLQVKLLRVLDDPVVMPVGGTTGVRVDVRIISATNRNLEEMAAEGKFREDLYYRLNVIPITVPPLRDRTADIPLLARHFAGQHAVKMGREAPKLASDAEEALRIYRWPGNVRELQNTMERAVALCRNGEILLEDLPPNLRDFAAKPQSPKANLSENGFDLEGYIADIEVDLIEQALKMAKYSQKRAAELLGLTTRSLRYRLQKYGLETS